MNVKGNNFLVRTASGAVFVAIIAVATSAWAGRLLLPMLMLAICGGSLWEFYRMARLAGLRPMRGYGMAAGLLSVAATAAAVQGAMEMKWLLLIFPLLSVFFIAELYRKSDKPIQNIGAGVAGVLYTAVPCALYICMVSCMTGGAGCGFPALAYFIIIWANDVGAYLVGSAIGRHKLFERISPKKSWEGFFGGFAFAVAAGFLAAYMPGMNGPMSGNAWLWIPLAAVISISGVLGDLVESMFKRSVGIKDSGRMMPGHGGFLDRFDSFLISVPLAAVLILIILLT